MTVPENFKITPYDRVSVGDYRYYKTPVGLMPSITTCLGLAGKDWIKMWEYRVGKAKANAIKEAAAERGSLLHVMCEHYMEGKPIPKAPPMVRAMFHAMLPYIDKFTNVRASEVALWSNKLKIAGTVDLIAEYEGDLCVIDFKTTIRMKLEEWIKHYYWQTCFYSIAWEEMSCERADYLLILMVSEYGEVQVYKKHRNEVIAEFVKGIIPLRNELNQISGVEHYEVDE